MKIFAISILFLALFSCATVDKVDNSNLSEYEVFDVLPSIGEHYENFIDYVHLGLKSDDSSNLLRAIKIRVNDKKYLLLIKCKYNCTSTREVKGKIVSVQKIDKIT